VYHRSAEARHRGSCGTRERLSTRATYVKTLTALAMTRPMTVSEISDCSAIDSFAYGAIGITPVGLNAVLVVSPRAR
jgi:hypothetical protein